MIYARVIPTQVGTQTLKRNCREAALLCGSRFRPSPEWRI